VIRIAISTAAFEAYAAEARALPDSIDVTTPPGLR
jgi:hypothetical protein